MDPLAERKGNFLKSEVPRPQAGASQQDFITHIDKGMGTFYVVHVHRGKKLKSMMNHKAEMICSPVAHKVESFQSNLSIFSLLNLH